jgi:hypothetical protein
MSISSATAVVVLLALESVSMAYAADNKSETKPTPTDAGGKYRHVTLNSFLRDNADETVITSLRDRTPVGHRQPRIRDIPATTQLSPLELEIRREDELIDKKLIICRGC